MKDLDSHGIIGIILILFFLFCIIFAFFEKDTEPSGYDGPEFYHYETFVPEGYDVEIRKK